MSAVGTIRSIAQGEMRAKPDMKPWVITSVINTYRVYNQESIHYFIFSSNSALSGLKKRINKLTSSVIISASPYSSNVVGIVFP